MVQADSKKVVTNPGSSPLSSGFLASGFLSLRRVADRLGNEPAIVFCGSFGPYLPMSAHTVDGYYQAISTEIGTKDSVHVTTSVGHVYRS